MDWYEQLPPLCPPTDASPCNGRKVILQMIVTSFRKGSYSLIRCSSVKVLMSVLLIKDMNKKLYIERILDFCDVPQLFIARDAFDTIYLCLLFEDDPSCRYTAIRVSSERLQSFLSGKEDLRCLFDNPENAFEYFDVEYRDNEYFFQPHESASVGEDRLPLTGYLMPENEQESVVVHIPVSDRNLLKDLVRKFGWACVF